MELDFDKLWREGRERWEKMTTSEIAVELGTSIDALYRWARMGRVPGLTKEFLDVRRRLDPLREVDRGDFDPGSGLIAYDYMWRKEALATLERFASLEDLIECGFIRGKQGRFENFLTLRIRDRLAFFAGTTPIAFRDGQATWFVVEPDEGEPDELGEVIDLVADYVDGLLEPPYRIRPSLRNTLHGEHQKRSNVNAKNGPS